MSIIKRKAGSEDIVKSVLEFDAVPTDGSPNLLESGAVAGAIAKGGKIAVFHVDYDMGQTVYPDPDEILAAINAGKFVVIDYPNRGVWSHTEWLLEYANRGAQDYIKFVNGSSALIATRDNTAEEPAWQWDDTGNLYDDQLDANSTNAVQNKTLYAVIGNVETLLAAL